MSPKHELEQNLDYLLSAAVRQCGNLADAEDLAGDTVLAVLTYLDRGGEIENMRAFLATVMRRTFYGRLRKKYRFPTVSIDDHPEVCEIAEEDNTRDEDYRRMMGELVYLTESYREVLVRHYFHGQGLEEIGDALGIPVGTVKSRLAMGREKIRKGMETNMEGYQAQSYAPERLYVWSSGNPGWNGEPGSLVNDDLIAQNLLILAYPAPITVSDLAKAIGIAAAYVEPIINKLVDNELMKRVGNRVYTDFLINDPTKIPDTHDAQTAFVKENLDIIFSPITNALDAIMDTDYFRALSAGEQQKLTLFIVMWCLDYGLFGAEERVVGNQIFPDRPNGGCWIAVGDIQRNSSAPLKEDNGYNGKYFHLTRDFLDTKEICQHGYGTRLGYRNSTFHPQGEINKLLYAIREGVDLRTAGLTEQLVHTDELVKWGFLKRDGDKLQTAIPFVEMHDFHDMIRKINRAIEQIICSLEEPMRAYLADKRKKIPSHLLTSVPAPKLIYGTDELVVLTVQEAIDRGVLPKLDYPCTAHMMVYWKG